MTPEDLKDKIICGTGHRPSKLGGYDNSTRNNLIRLAMYGLNRIKPALVISGMALGWDQALAQGAWDLGIPFEAYVPCISQDSKWSGLDRARYAVLLSKAKKVVYVTNHVYTDTCMQERNIAMVEASDGVLALWDGSDGGTANCITYAKTIPKPIFNLWKRWEAGEF